MDLNQPYLRPNASNPSSSHPSHRNRSNQVFPTPNVAATHSPNQLSLPNPWDSPQDRFRLRVSSMNERPSPHSSSPSNLPNVSNDASISFPEPHFIQPIAADSSSLHVPSRGLQHRHSAGDFRSQSRFLAIPYKGSGAMSSQKVGGPKDYDPEFRDKSSMAHSNSYPDDLRRFQEGKLSDREEEWHRLVSQEAQEALGKKEVRRQSVMFEIIKGERDYVADLELVLQLFIDGLRSARPEIMPKTQLSSFIIDVFSNIQEILDLHRQLLNALFERQREQHPLLQTIGDIILDKTIRTEFRSAYESYIMHYPLAESFHRKELKRNGAYEKFIHSISNDPRVRKRDLITFLSRPVTRLPRLNLLLEETLKSTEKDFEHPDLETLPLTLGILRDCIKSTQPGIEAAESKVQFWQLCESLIYKKGEIIDMDLYDQSRTLVYSSPAARRIRSDAGFHEWDDLEASLLDNYLLFTREEKLSAPSTVERHLASRPIHLSFLRLGSFSDASITRKEKLEGGLLDSLRSQSVPIFPFTIFHSYSRSTRRYTLYVTSESLRKKWKNALSEASALHRLREDSNKWFDPQNVTSSFFSAPVEIATPTRSSGPTGRITSAVPFIFSERKFLAVGCSTGIFVSVAGHEDFKRVLHYSNPTYMAALQTAGSKVYNRFVVYYESTIVSHSLDLLARLTLGQTTREILEASSERIGGSESNITFCKSVQIGDRALVVYASKRRLSSSLTLQVMEAVDRTEMEGLRQKRTNTRVLAFRPFGEPGFIPRDAFDITALTKNIAICTQDGIVIANPTNLAESAVTVVPDLRDAASSVSMSILKERLKDAKPLGLARVDSNELLVIYDSVGCYITKLGVPSRSCGYIRWEIQASGFAHRGNHILLVSSQFIEIRNINTGRIAQVIEGTDVRLMYTGFGTDDRDDRVLVAMRGSKNDKDGTSAERIVELIETVEYAPQSTVSTVPDVWDEWDM